MRLGDGLHPGLGDELGDGTRASSQRAERGWLATFARRSRHGRKHEDDDESEVESEVGDKMEWKSRATSGNTKKIACWTSCGWIWGVIGCRDTSSVH